MLRDKCNWQFRVYFALWLQSIYPYQKYNQVNLEIFGKTQCITEYHFTKIDIPWLFDALQMFHKLVCCQWTIVNNTEILCMLLKRLYPCRLSDMKPLLSDMKPLFGRNPTEVCLTFNCILDYVYNGFNHLLISWNRERNSSWWCPFVKLIWVC